MPQPNHLPKHALTLVNAMTYATDLLKVAAAHAEAGIPCPPFVLQALDGSPVLQFEMRVTHFGTTPVGQASGEEVLQVRVRDSGGAYTTNTIRGRRASCTHSAKAAAQALAGKLAQGTPWKLDAGQRDDSGDMVFELRVKK